MPAVQMGWVPLARKRAAGASAIAIAVAINRCKGLRIDFEDVVELNTRGRYAVMSMTDLAKHGGADAVPLSAIAERQHISLAYLEQLFVRLRRAGLVESSRGRSGGYRLGRPATEITVAEVMAAVEEDVRMTRCSGEQAQHCIGGERCLTHELWHALGDEIGRFLAGITLQDVLNGISPRIAVPVGEDGAAVGQVAAS